MCVAEMVFLFLSFATNAVPWLISILSICIFYFSARRHLFFILIYARGFNKIYYVYYYTNFLPLRMSD